MSVHPSSPVIVDSPNLIGQCKVPCSHSFFKFEWSRRWSSFLDYNAVMALYCQQKNTTLFIDAFYIVTILAVVLTTCIVYIAPTSCADGH